MYVISRFRDKKSTRLKKRGFFQFLAVFGTRKGGIGPNFQNIFFCDNQYSLRQTITNFQNFILKYLIYETLKLFCGDKIPARKNE